MKGHILRGDRYISLSPFLNKHKLFLKIIPAYDKRVVDNRAF